MTGQMKIETTPAGQSCAYWTDLGRGKGLLWIHSRESVGVVGVGEGG